VIFRNEPVEGEVVIVELGVEVSPGLAWATPLVRETRWPISIISLIRS